MAQTFSGFVGDLSEFDFSDGSPSYITSSPTPKYGPIALKLLGDVGDVRSRVNKGGCLADAGRRSSTWFCWDGAIENARNQIISGYTSGGGAVWRLSIDQATNKLDWETGAKLGTAVLNISTWYRISWAYVITSTSDYTFKVWVNGVLDFTATAADTNLGNSGSDTVWLTNNLPSPTTMSAYFTGFSVDDGTTLDDMGDERTVNKRPNANGSLNEFTAQIGSGGSGYGSGHSPQVNEWPFDASNGWSVINAGSVQTEEYNIENLATGAIDLTGAPIVGVMGWVHTSALISETGQLVLNGGDSSISITSTATLFRAYDATYPAGTGADIGVKADATVTTVSLFECGVLVTYISEPPPSGQTVIATSQVIPITGPRRNQLVVI